MSLASPFFEALIGKQITHVWQGYGSAIFIEIGKLAASPKMNGEPGQPNGEFSVMIEWSWRIERPKSILGGSWSSEKRWPKMFENLIGATVSNVQCFGSVPELCLSLSNGLRVASFMTAEGQPKWAILSRDSGLGSLGIKKGAFHVEPPNL